MSLKPNIIVYFFLVSFGFNSSFLSAQKNQSNFIKQLDNLYNQDKLDSIVFVADKSIQTLKTKKSKDSLLFAKLYLYQFIGLHETNKSIDNLSSLTKGIGYCPKTNTGDSLKAVFYNRKAYLESELVPGLASYKSTLQSLKILERIPNPNPDYFVGAYLLLSNQNAYYGNFEQAKYYTRLVENILKKNKTNKNYWSQKNTNHQLEVIAKYRKIYMLWKIKEANDSILLVNTMKDLAKMYAQPDFHKKERIYYSTALNHVGDWFISITKDSLATQKGIKSGLKYLFKALDLTENKGYPGTIWAIKYNIAKGFTKGNLLHKADSTMAVLFKGVSKTDRRIPFFLAQKGLIKAKKKQKDSALFYFNKSVQKIHLDSEELKIDYSNFKPSKRYNHTTLLLRISEELNNYYPTDSLVQKKIARLHYMALQQFENSYLNVSFNAEHDQKLRQIIKGILNSKETGYNHSNPTEKGILNTFEIIKNQLEWKKFYESRLTNTLPELDKVKNRKLELASLLNKAKIDENILQADSIQSLITKHKSRIKEQFPQLALLSNFEFSIELLQKNITEKDLILKFILLEDEIAIYQISKTNFKVHLIPWTTEENEKLKDFIEKIRNRNHKPELASVLGKTLIPPLNKSIQNLIINPDGILFKLPFEVLQIDEKLATELYTISYTSNLGFINHSSEKNTSLKNVHVYAPVYDKTNNSFETREKASFLKGATNESKSISKLFPSKLFNTKNLTKSEFTSTAGKAKILHLAMHAEVNSDYPQLSRFLFNNTNENDESNLYLEELYGLSLNAELAILSACNTGNGLEKNGSLDSFQRAFTFAGVSATVASLWEVPDLATEQIMVLFYKNLKAGQTKSMALRNAKLSFRNKNSNNKLAEPYFWAGFVVYGNDAPIIYESSLPSLYIIFGIILTIFTLWFFKKKKRVNLF